MTHMCQQLLQVSERIYYTGVKLFIIFPPTLKMLNHNTKVFKLARKDYISSLLLPCTSDENSKLVCKQKKKKLFFAGTLYTCI